MNKTPKHSALRNRIFLKIWLASVVSGTAVAAHDTAATWMMNSVSQSGLFISLMTSLASLPFFLLTLPAGTLADTFCEGRILRSTNLWLAGCAGSLALLGWAGMLNPTLLLVGVFLLGVGYAINAPAWASLVPQVVTDEELPSASALSGVQLNIASILGPALAGILLAKVGAPFVFGLNATGFLLVSMAIPILPKTGSDLSPTLSGFARSISNSFRYVRQTQNVRNIFISNAIFSSFVAVVPALMPVLLLKELRLDGSSLGLVFASMGVGSVVSAIFLLPWLRSRFSTGALLVISQVTLAGIYFLMGMVHHSVYCLIPMALAGASWTLAASELWVIAQRAIPNSVRGRTSALMMVLSQGAIALGGIVWGLSAEISGTRSTLLTAAFLFFVATILSTVLLRSPGQPDTGFSSADTINMSPNEPSGFGETLIQRKESARQTLRKTSCEELRASVDEQFPDGSHPWAVSFSKFIDEHQAEPAVRGETSDDIVYYPQSRRGIWYECKGKTLIGVGLLGQTSLRALSEIVSGTEHSDLNERKL